MAEMGYVLSSEEMSPNEMVRNARRAEGFAPTRESQCTQPMESRFRAMVGEQSNIDVALA
jgi:hypothetical protein